MGPMAPPPPPPLVANQYVTAPPELYAVPLAEKASTKLKLDISEMKCPSYLLFINHTSVH